MPHNLGLYEDQAALRRGPGGQSSPLCRVPRAARTSHLEPITDNAITALEKTYHTDHFFGTTCKTPLEAQYFPHNNRPYCGSCIQGM